MTVAELVQELLKLPSNEVVILRDADTGWFFSDPILISDDGITVIASKDEYAGRHFLNAAEAKEKLS